MKPSNSQKQVHKNRVILRVFQIQNLWEKTMTIWTINSLLAASVCDDALETAWSAWTLHPQKLWVIMTDGFDDCWNWTKII